MHLPLPATILATLLAATPATAAERWLVFATDGGAVAYDVERSPAGGVGGPLLIIGLDWRAEPVRLANYTLGWTMVTLAADCAAGAAAVTEILAYGPDGAFLEAILAESGALTPVADSGPSAILFRGACGGETDTPLFEAPSLAEVLAGLARRR